MRLQRAATRVHRRGCICLARVGLEEGNQDEHGPQQSQVRPRVVVQRMSRDLQRSFHWRKFLARSGGGKHSQTVKFF